ncbi:MAG: DUF4159 domain-containing protein [Rhodospirillaceae bacterium]
MGFISFASPWILAGAAALPLVWLLLRLTPPAVRQINFPAIRLLFNLDPTQRTTAHTPPWLIILRLAILMLVLLGLADPVLNLVRGGDRSGPVVVAFDDGWAAATHWASRVKALRDTLEAADRRGQPVAVVSTAPANANAPLRLQSGREALETAVRLAPSPWPTDRVKAAERVRGLIAGGKMPAGASAVWISDGVDGPGAGDFTTALQAVGPLTVIDAAGMTQPLVQFPPNRSFTDAGSGAKSEASGNDIEVKLGRIGDGQPAISETVRALDGDGQVVAQAVVGFTAGASTASARMAMPTELANRIARFDVENVASAGTAVLSDDHWQRRPVGLASATAAGVRAPLLENAYYIREALGPYADIRSGDLDALLERPLAVLMMADGGKILDAEAERIDSWVQSGGLLVRFAGPGLESNVDALLPVKLREGGRTFGGAMSWSTPAAVAPFPATSPFKDLLVPDDVTVLSQVLAEPAADLTAKTWARLKDGTPLVTAARRGQGWVVLFHVTATPEWSKLPLSGLFVDMLRRLVDISRGVQGEAEEATGMLAPRSLLDGFGRLTAPGPTATAIPAKDIANAEATAATPPGLYGPPGATRALNLSAGLAELKALPAPPMSATHVGFESVASERVLKPWLLTAALILLLADLAISFALRRLLPERLSAVTGGIVLLCLLVPAARAAEVAKEKDIDASIRAAIVDTRLAYAATGSTEVDKVTQAGLAALTQVLGARTAAELAEPARVDLTASNITVDGLLAYPLIYWRMTPSFRMPPARALAALNTYLHRGGMVVFDAPDQAGALAADGKNHGRLEEIVHNLDIPPVSRVGNDHVLTRTFYLMKGLPGRYVDGEILVEQGSNANDGTSSVIIGANDWAAAWAKDANGIPLYATIPGGETQRELAFRSGVNMVMYALTGNYKADLVHLPAIMQRLTQ